jgi:hypothetical protein
MSGKRGGQIFVKGMVLEHMEQEDNISFSVLWNLGLVVIRILIK